MNLPPYFSRTPPPLNGIDDEENDDEEFGTFVVSSDLGEEVFDVFDKTSHTLRCEDNISEDSGFCMNSVGQAQSPCDISPLSSSYNNKGNDCLNVESQGTTDPESSIDERNSTKVVENPEENCDLSYAINIPPHDDEDDIPAVDVANEIYHLHVNPNGNASEENYDGQSEHSLHLTESDTNKVSLDSNNIKNPTDENVFSNFNETGKHLEIKERTDVLFPKNNFSEIENVLPDSSNATLSNPSISYSSDLFLLKENNLEARVINDISSFSAFDSYEPDVDGRKFPKTETKSETVNVNEWVSDDEFSDFTSFQSTSSCVERPYTEAKCIDLDDDFPDLPIFEDSIPEVNTYSYCTLQSAIETNIVWNSLQCFEETPAFKYQWASSFTNMKFLQALQIDSRNILHGPWSKTIKLYWSDVPSNYENINFNSDFLDCSSRPSPKDVQSETIPDPHFDWVGSGLVNPLQTLTSKDHTVELQFDNSSSIHNSKTKNILETLPTLSFVKAHHIVFKRD